ncbi:MAG: hypothetical protein K2G85_03305 [Muribaculaceae bacterium]|nr:hypothetical protein [Muribaculaceae bacterium]
MEKIAEKIDNEVRKKVEPKDIVGNIFSLRSNFIIIGLTGRTGSGCTTVAKILAEPDFDSLKSKYKLRKEGIIDNDARKERIVYEFISKNWQPYTVITASNVIYFFSFILSFNDFIAAVAHQWASLDNNSKPNGQQLEQRYIESITQLLKDIEVEYNHINSEINELKIFISQKGYKTETDIVILNKYVDVLLKDLPQMRNKIEKRLSEKYHEKIPELLQNWGDNIRRYKQIKPGIEQKDAPEALAVAINKFIKVIRRRNEMELEQNKVYRPTRIVIDSLRNPFEILYFRERWSSFYCLSVNAPKNVRHDKLMKDRNLKFKDVLKIDNRESAKKEVSESFRKIDIDRCLQLADIHLAHNGIDVNENFQLINQLFTYLSLMLHPGLVPPSPQERLMQIAYTAKLNSGCLSRQVGAAITDKNYSLKAIGWNSVPEGQVPCALRQFGDLIEHLDQEAFSQHEKGNEKFREAVLKLNKSYNDVEILKNLKGLPLRYCFKDIHTTIEPHQKYNQVHTRSLHAEENAFLQIAKYGGAGIEGGKLFTTASCCELCAKKAYHLGIKEIYYIDSYPGISLEHILMAGAIDKGPKLLLFHGAVGRAYINLYNPFMPFKDELEAITGIDVKEVVEPNKPAVNDIQNNKTKKHQIDGDNNTDPTSPRTR